MLVSHLNERNVSLSQLDTVGDQGGWNKFSFVYPTAGQSVQLVCKQLQPHSATETDWDVMKPRTDCFVINS